MSRTKRTVKKRGVSLWLFIVIITITIITIAFFVFGSATRHGDEQAHTTEQQHRFYENELRSIIENCLGGKTPYPEINERYQKLNTELIGKFGKNLNINLVTSYHFLSKKVEMATGTQTNGTPEIAIYIPSVMDMFENIRKRHGDKWKVRFKTHFLAVFMHEMEHTTYADILTDGVDISEESRAWMETCRHTLRPMTRKHELTLISTEAKTMKAWVNSGENTNSAVWIEHINELYSELVKPKPVR